MNSEPEISIIVPMYKVEKFINRCVESIISQTFSKFELLLIDDGSPDKCYEKCLFYAKRDQRVKVYHKENGGLSDARNYGLGLARGRYITFIDSDDYVTSDYLETLYYMIVANDADIAIGNYQIVTDNRFLASLSDSHSKSDVKLFDGKEALFQLLATDNYIQMDTAWAKLIKIEIARKHHFPVGRFHEDEATTYLYYMESKCVVVTDKIIYGYYKNEKGIMQSAMEDKKREDALWALSERAMNLENQKWNYEANMAWLFVYGWLCKFVIDNPKSRWKWKMAYKKLQNADSMTGDIKRRAFFLMHFPYSFSTIQKIRGKS